VDNSISIADLIAAGFTVAEFKAAGYTLAELIALGFTLVELKLEFELAELKLEFELAELKLEFELTELKELFTLAELIEAGFTLAELKLEFELAELIAAGFSIAELRAAGFTAGEFNVSPEWIQIGQDIDGEAVNSRSGYANGVTLSGDGSIVAIGAPFNNDDNGNASGHVRVYQNDDGTWTQIGQDIDGEAAGDQSGFGVALSDDGSIVAIGAYRNDGNGDASGHVRVYKNESVPIGICGPGIIINSQRNIGECYPVVVRLF